MKKIASRLLGLVTSAVLAVGLVSYTPKETVTAADINSLTAKQISQQMGAGWNLGNTLEATGGSGMTSETSWGNPRATKQIFEAVKAQGFSTVRIPVTWGNHIIDNKNTIDPEWFARVHTVVDWALDEGLFVILNLHHEDDWLIPKSANYSAVSAKLTALWKQIATEFAYYDKNLIFEGMNEPRDKGGAHEWDGGTYEMRNVINSLNADFVATVRKTGGFNDTRALMIPTYAASNTTAAMSALVLPDDSNLIVSVHAYTPYRFAMTGYKTFDDDMEGELAGFFNNLDTYFINKGIPVCIGEFGASNYGNDAERAKWGRSFANKAKSRKTPIVIWDNNTVTSSSNPNDCYGLLDRDTYQWASSARSLVNNIVSVYGKLPHTYTYTDDSDGSVSLKGSNWWAETTVTRSTLLAGYNASEVESVTFSSTWAFTLFYGSNRVNNVYEYTLKASDIPDSIRLAVSANDGRMKNIGWTVKLKASAVPAFSITGANKRSYGTAFSADDNKLTVSIPSGCSAFTDLGGITYSSAAPTVKVSAIVVNSKYLVPVGKELKGSDSTARLLAPVTGAGKVNGAIYSVKTGGCDFGFFGDGGKTITFRDGGSTVSVKQLDYILTDEITPELLGVREFEQFTEIDSDGIYAQRHIILAPKEMVIAAKEVEMTYSANGISRSITTDKYYTSLTADGKNLTAPSGKVYVATTLTRIKNNFYPKTGSNGKAAGLSAGCVLKF